MPDTTASTFHRIWEFPDQGGAASSTTAPSLIISETDQPGFVSIETTGRVLLTRAQWEALGQLTKGYSAYGSDFVRFAPEPQQQSLGILAADLEDLSL